MLTTPDSASSPLTRWWRITAARVRALIAGACDTCSGETIFDTLNAKAALVALEQGLQGGRKLHLPFRSPQRWAWAGKSISKKVRPW